MTIAVDLGRKATKLRILVAGLRDNIIDNRWIEYDHNFILLHVIQHRPQIIIFFISQPKHTLWVLKMRPTLQIIDK